MIITKLIDDIGDGVNRYCRYSDKGVMLLQVETGRIYDNPIDIEGAPFTYIETDIKIEQNSEESTNELTEQVVI